MERAEAFEIVPGPLKRGISLHYVFNSVAVSYLLQKFGRKRHLLASFRRRLLRRYLYKRPAFRHENVHENIRAVIVRHSGYIVADGGVGAKALGKP